MDAVEQSLAQGRFSDDIITRNCWHISIFGILFAMDFLAAVMCS
jgi:hypothetical protein